MHIEITGGTKLLRQQIESVARFSADMLMSKRLQKNLWLEFELTRELYKSEGNLGDVMWNDRNHSPRDYSIRIDITVPRRRILESVCHEMVHVKQYARNELRELTSQKRHRFRGEYYDHDMDYYDEPWEIEAHGREVGLFVRWAEKNKLSKQKWTQV